MRSKIDAAVLEHRFSKKNCVGLEATVKKKTNIPSNIFNNFFVSHAAR